MSPGPRPDGPERDGAERRSGRRRRLCAAPTAQARAGLFADAGHELRTPLHAVVGMARLLAGTDLDDEQREYVAFLQSSAASLAAVLDDLVDSVAMEGAGLQLSDAPFRPSDVVRECTELLAPQAAEKRVRLVSEIAPSTPAVLTGDGARLRRIVLRAVEDAVRSCASGGEVGIVVAATPAAGGRAEVEICVRAPVADAVGEPAGRAALARHVARALCEAMGGRLELPEAGDRAGRTRIVVTCGVPAPTGVAPTNVAPTTVAPTAVAPPGGRAPASRPLRVLVADDDALSREVVVRTLERLGHLPTVARDGREALDASDAEDFDAVVVDLHMPGMDGFEAVRELRRRGAQPVVIGMTAGMSPADSRACLDSGMVTCLEKPPDPARLADALEHAASGDLGVPGEAPARDALDPSVLESLARLGGPPGGRTVLARMIDIFLTATPGEIAGLSACAAQGDLDGVRQRAHRFRGMSAVVGAPALGGLAAALERIDDGDAAGAVALAARLVRAWPATRDALEEARAGR